MAKNGSSLTFRVFGFLLLIAALLTGGRFAFIYGDWFLNKSKILDELAGYKKQLDDLRAPVPVEELAGQVEPGTVSIPTRVYDRNGVLIGEYFHERRQLILLSDLPEHVPQTLIASEDRNFYRHSGINFKAIARAMLVNLSSFRFAQGGSTITQQLAKVLFTAQDKSLDRKVFEFFCAREIEKRYTKDEILEMYLNLIYMGHGNYGIESASQAYFGKSARNLTRGESAMIIGLLPNPNNFSPLKDLKIALNRQSIVLGTLVDSGQITEKDKTRIIGSFRNAWKVREKENIITSSIGDFKDSAYRLNLAPYFMEHIRLKLLEKFSMDTIRKGGLQVYTTLDYEKQVQANIQLKAAIDSQKKWYAEAASSFRKIKKTDKAAEYEAAIEKTNGAFISIEPATGYVLTMIGGAEFSQKNMFNRATKANRQIGSLMKPFVYYLGIARKEITPATLIKDEKLVIGKHEYKNYDHKFLGEITVREALKRSRNTTAVRSLSKTGVDQLRTLIGELLDIPADQLQTRVPREMGIALGTPSFTPMEVARMYAIMANHGKLLEPRTLLRVTDSRGKILWEDDRNIAEKEILDPVASYITISMLQGVFEKNGTAGFVERLRNQNEKLNFDMAGKTGTTSDYTDAWFAGITSDEASVLWVGADDNTTLGSGRSGGSICAPAWINYISATRSSSPPMTFLENWPLEKTVRESFCADSGGVPRSSTSCPEIVQDQVFYEGTEPRFFDPRTDPGTSTNEDPLLY